MLWFGAAAITPAGGKRTGIKQALIAAKTKIRTDLLMTVPPIISI
jgi:hypothetical protein